MKRMILTLLFMLIAGALPASGASDHQVELATPETVLLELFVENTTELSDNQLMLEIMAVLRAQPQLYADKEVHLTVGQVTEKVDFNVMMVETIGIKEKISPSQFAQDVGSVIGQTVGGVHGSASVKVKFSETQKKNADGSSETSKSVDVTVTVSAGKK